MTMALDDSTSQLIQTKLLGWGPAAPPLFPGEHIARDIEFAGGDLALVTGRDNLSQDLTLALTTALGTDPFNVDYGFDGVNALVEEQNATIARERVRVSVIKLLTNDPRVRRILDVDLNGTQTDPQPSQLPGDGFAARRILNVQVAFETLAGDQSAVDLGEVKLNA